MQHHPLATAVAACRCPARSTTVVHGADRDRAAARLAARRPRRVARPRGRRRPFSSAGSPTSTPSRSLESAGEAVADRAPDPLPPRPEPGRQPCTQRWVCTQTAICKVVDGRLAVIDLLCSGFREVEIGEIENDDARPRHVAPRMSEARRQPALWPSPRGVTTTGTTRSRCSPQVRAAGPVHEVTAGRRAPGVAGRRPRRGQGGAERPAAVQGHARGAGPQRRGRRGGPARAGAGPPHARRRPARPHPAAPAGDAGVQPAARRGAGGPGPVDRHRAARRARRPRHHRPSRRPRGRLRLPAAVHGDQRAARHPGARPRRPRPVVPHPARPDPCPSRPRTWRRPTRSSPTSPRCSTTSAPHPART